jgi:hypothetical protein
MQNLSEVKQIHTAEPLETGPSSLQVKIAIAKLKKYKLIGSDKTVAELIQVGGEKITVCNPQTHEFYLE